jgi:hypothetical protein
VSELTPSSSRVCLQEFLDTHVCDDGVAVI